MSTASQPKAKFRSSCRNKLTTLCIVAVLAHTGMVYSHELQVKPKQPTKALENLTVDQMQQREQDIIAREWRVVRPLLSTLDKSRLDAPEYGFSRDNRGKNFCEALQRDLVAGNYAMVRKPEISASEVGTKEFVQAYLDAEKGCPNELRGSDRFVKDFEKAPNSIKRPWISFIPGGLARWYFDYKGNHLLFTYETDACRNRLEVPNWPRKGTVKFKDPPEGVEQLGTTSRDYTETLAISVVQRRSGEFIALEYIETTGTGDEYQKGPWGGSHLPQMGWTPASDPTLASSNKSLQKKSKHLKKPVLQDNELTTHFLGAFIAPHPWEALFPEEEWSHEGEFGFPNAPCVWQID